MPLLMTPLPKKSYRHQLGPMIHLSTTQKFNPLLLINLENIKVGQISFLNVATFKSTQVPWTYFFSLSIVTSLSCDLCMTSLSDNPEFNYYRSGRSTPVESGRRRHASSLSTASSIDADFFLNLQELPMSK